MYIMSIPGLTLLVELSEKGEEKKEVIICMTGMVTYCSRTISCLDVGRPLLATWREIGFQF